jgi:hypothetical protein
MGVILKDNMKDKELLNLIHDLANKLTIVTAHADLLNRKLKKVDVPDFCTTSSDAILVGSIDAREILSRIMEHVE